MIAHLLHVRRMHTAFATAAVLFLGAGPAVAAGPTPSFLDPVARLAYGQMQGMSNLVLKLDGLDATSLADPNLIKGKSIVDLRQPDPPKVEVNVESKELLPAGASSRRWLLTIAVKGLPPTAWMNWLSQHRHPPTTRSR